MNTGSTTGRLIRWGLAVLLAGVVGYALRRSELAFLLSLPLLVVIGVLIVPELIRPLTWMIDVIMGTVPAEGDRPPLDLRLARHYLKQQRWEEALEEYLRVMKLYPEVSEPYEQAMVLIARLEGDRRAVERIYRKGRRRIRDLQQRAGLERAHGQAIDLLRPAARQADP